MTSFLRRSHNRLRYQIESQCHLQFKKVTQLYFKVVTQTIIYSPRPLTLHLNQHCALMRLSLLIGIITHSLQVSAPFNLLCEFQVHFVLVKLTNVQILNS